MHPGEVMETILILECFLKKCIFCTLNFSRMLISHSGRKGKREKGKERGKARPRQKHTLPSPPFPQEKVRGAMETHPFARGRCRSRGCWALPKRFCQRMGAVSSLSCSLQLFHVP